MRWLRQWFEDRSTLRDGPGRRQTDLHIESVFTDDTQYRVLGIEGKIRADRAWHLTCKTVNVIMEQASKRQHGTHYISLGIGFIETLGIAYITQDKLGRCVERLEELRNGTLSFEHYRSLLGLLEHVLFLANMDRDATSGLYKPLNRLNNGLSKLSDIVTRTC